LLQIYKARSLIIEQELSKEKERKKLTSWYFTLSRRDSKEIARLTKIMKMKYLEPKIFQR